MGGDCPPELIYSIKIQTDYREGDPRSSVRTSPQHSGGLGRHTAPEVREEGGLHGDITEGERGSREKLGDGLTPG
jgi:hypothetical protein